MSSRSTAASSASRGKELVKERLPRLHGTLLLARLAARRHQPGRRVRWGNTRRLHPYSDIFGWDRGRPVDRFYIEDFIGRHAGDIRGDVLEVRDDRYSSRFGSAERVEILDRDPDNADATLRADLDVPGSLPTEHFDSIVLTQVLQYTDPPAALRNLWNALRPGGVLLMTVPSLARIDPAAVDHDRWRWTPRGLRRLLDDAGFAEAQVEGFGNMLACQAAILGLTVEDLTAEELVVLDPDFPLIAGARIAKP